MIGRKIQVNDNKVSTFLIASNQTAGNDVMQVAGGSSIQVAGDSSIQMAGESSKQIAGDDSAQSAGDNSFQKAGVGSTQMVGNESIQIAGEGSIQIGYWFDNGIRHVKTRVVSEKEANKPYRFRNGEWIPQEMEATK